MNSQETSVANLERRFENLSHLYDLTAALGNSLSIESSLKVFLDKLIRTLQLEMAELYVVERGQGLASARLRAAVSQSPSPRERDQLPAAVALAFDDNQQGCARFEDRQRSFPELGESLVALEAFRLHTGQRAVGILLLGSASGDSIQDALDGIVPKLARRVAIAIDHARVYEQLEREAVHNRYLLDSLREAVFRVDERGRLTFLNGAWTEVLGYSQDESLGRPLTDFLHPEEPVGRLTSMLHMTERCARRNLRFSTQAGKTVWLELSCRSSAETGCSGCLADVSERKQLEERLLHAALHDGLTDLPNRALFLNRLQYALSRNLRYDDYHFAVLFLDLDRFKLINDSLGHEVGDELLIAFAKRLRTCLRTIDMTARLGGDEFAIIADGIHTHDDAAGLAERIQRKTVTPFRLGSHEVFTSVSIGVALSASQYRRPEDLLRDADTAMYRAKSAGRACHVVFDNEMHTRAVARLGLENALRHALDRGEFELYYQPIVRLSDMRIGGFEALVRWNHPERGLVYPAEFLAMAEENGLIVPLGAQILRRAAEQALHWQRSVEEVLTVSVNLAAVQVRQPNFVEEVSALLAEVPVDPSRLILEITESAFLEDTHWHVEVLEALHNLGLTIAIDDFGTGYSALGYLTRFPVDILKIDRSFVTGMDANNHKSKIVRALVGLAHNLGMSVTAEGVERDAELQQLCQLHCESAQGWHFSKAIPGGAADDLLKQQSAPA